MNRNVYNTRTENKIPLKHVLLVLFIFILWGVGGWVAPANAGPLKDAAAFTENKILPAADEGTKKMTEYVKKEAPPAFEKAKQFTETKVIPNAKIAGEVIADKSKKVWQALLAD